VTKDLTQEIKELNKRITELEDILSVLVQPVKDVQHMTSNYFKILQLLLEHGRLSPDLILPEVKDPISKDIVMVLMDKKDQNISQITELVRSKRGTASRRIIREKLSVLIEKNIIHKEQKGSLYIYNVSSEVIKKWSQLLGISL